MDLGKGMLVIGRAERMGLGTMTEDFCRAFDPDRVVVLGMGNGRDVNPSNVRGKSVVVVRRTDFVRNLRTLFDGTRVVVGFETWYNDELPRHCRAKGVRTVMFPMWEWSPPSAYESDVLVCLSDTDDKVSTSYPKWVRVERVDWPASPAVHDPSRVLNWPPKTFVHCAGNAAHNRDGTKEVLHAASHLKGTDAKLIVYSAFNPASLITWDVEAPVEIRGPVTSRAELFDECDCLVCPRRLPGHSLPINEALGEGIPVVCLDLTDWRSFPYRVPAHAQPRERFGRSFVDVWRADPAELGTCLRNMALGQVSKVEQPRVPTWDEFKERWLTWNLTSNSNKS